MEDRDSKRETKREISSLWKREREITKEKAILRERDR